MLKFLCRSSSLSPFTSKNKRGFEIRRPSGGARREPRFATTQDGGFFRGWGKPRCRKGRRISSIPKCPSGIYSIGVPKQGEFCHS